MTRQGLCAWIAFVALAVTVSGVARPAQAWHFSPTPICTIWHDTGRAEMRVTFDAQDPQPYAISVTLAQGVWPQAALFAIAFGGEQPFTISTDRHVLSLDGRSVLVKDRGFGNVLRGLAGGLSANARLGDKAYGFPLANARDAVDRFRACTQPRGMS